MLNWKNIVFLLIMLAICSCLGTAALTSGIIYNKIKINKRAAEMNFRTDPIKTGKKLLEDLEDLGYLPGPDSIVELNEKHGLIELSGVSITLEALEDDLGTKMEAKFENDRNNKKAIRFMKRLAFGLHEEKKAHMYYYNEMSTVWNTVVAELKHMELTPNMAAGDKMKLGQTESLIELAEIEIKLNKPENRSGTLVIVEFKTDPPAGHAGAFLDRVQKRLDKQIL